MFQIEFLDEIVEQQQIAIGFKDTGMAREQLKMLPDTRSCSIIR
jgi:hypothetical protein